MDGYQCREHGVTEPCAYCLEDELVSLRARIAAAVELCEEIERDHAMDVAHSRGHGMVDAAEAIRRLLETT